MEKRAVITGMGIICGIGHNKKEVFESIKSCRCGIQPIRRFDVSLYDCRYGSEVKNYDVHSYFDDNTLEYANLCTQYALVAVRESLEEARLDLSALDPHDVGICVGSSHGALDVIFEYYKKKFDFDNEEKKISRNFLFRKLHSSTLKVIAHEFNINGMISMISTACASGTNALGMAADWIWAGRAKYVIAGGSDILEQPLHAGFWGLKAVSPRPCSPFSGEPGMNLGEGASFFIVEDISTALARKSPILAEILGYGLSGDAYHVTSPNPQGTGVILAMERAAADARIQPGDIEYVNAHGTGTDGNDSMESIAHEHFFGERSGQVPMSSTKSYFGHATGAAGPLETCVSIMCMHEGILPPTLNFTTPRYANSIDYIPNQVREKKIHVFMKSSFGFAGNNAVVVLGQYDPQRISPPQRFKELPVVITGIGVVSPIGVGFSEYGKALQEKRNAIKKIQRFSTAMYSSPYGCMIDDFQTGLYDRQIDADRRMDLVSQFSSVAAGLCLDDAGIPKKRKHTSDIGIIMCVSSAPCQGIDEHLKKMITKGADHPSSIFFPYSTQNSALGHVSLDLGFQGFTSNLHVDGCSGINGIIYGLLALQFQRQKKIIVGGGDEIFWSYFDRLSILDELSRENTPYVPFSEDSHGYHPGEGGIFMLLETLEDALQRNARIYAELIGFGTGIDSNGEITRNDPSGRNLIDSINKALVTGNVKPEQIGWINCTERGLKGIREAESAALLHFWDKQMEEISIINTVPLTGWMDSISPLMNLAAMIYSAQNQILVPQYDCSSIPSPLAPAFTPKKINPERRYGLCLGVAREGYNYALVLKPYENNKKLKEDKKNG